MDQQQSKKKILVVDDAPENIDALTGILRPDFLVKTATSGPKALEIAFSKDPPDLILLDIMMPDMDGYEVCRRLKKHPSGKLMPVIFVTALDAPADEAQALRMGGVDFITKPFQPVVVRARIETHLKLRQTTHHLKGLLSKTFLGSIQMLMQILSLTNPLAFSQASRIKKYVRDVAAHLELEELWRFETAALLSNIGCVALPLNLLTKVMKEEACSKEELNLFQSHPALGADLIDDIPGLEEVAAMILHQQDPYDPQVHKGPPISWNPGRLGGHILKIVLDFDRKIFNGEKPYQAMVHLAGQPETYSPELVNVLEKIQTAKPPMKKKTIAVEDLRPGMILMHDLVDSEDCTVVRTGSELTQESVKMIRRYHENNKLKEPIHVKVTSAKGSNY